MKKIFCCKDLGISCNWKGSAETVEDLLKLVAEHARTAHNVMEMNDAMRIKILGKMRETSQS